MTNEHKYILRKYQGKEIQSLNYKDERFRKIMVEIDPMDHIEMPKILKLMKSGDNIYKRTQNKGKLHIRYFMLTPDCNKICWVSSKKIPEECEIYISDIKEIKLG